MSLGWGLPSSLVMGLLAFRCGRTSVLAKPLLTVLTRVHLGLVPALCELRLLCQVFISISQACCSNILSTSFPCLPIHTSTWQQSRGLALWDSASNPAQLAAFRPWTAASILVNLCVPWPPLPLHRFSLPKAFLYCLSG